VALASAFVAVAAFGGIEESRAEGRSGDGKSAPRPKITVRVELPPGVKPSDVTVKLTGSGYDDYYKATLNDQGEATIDALRGDHTFVIVTAGDRTMTTTVYVPRSGAVAPISIKAAELADADAYYDPDKVYDRGRTAAAAGDGAGVTAAADALDGAATAHQRYAADFRQSTIDLLRDVLSGLPPDFVNDFLRDFRAAQTPEDRQQVVRRYRNSATINAPDAIVPDEFRASRAAFLRLANGDMRSTFAPDQERTAAQDRERASALRQLAEQSSAPPGHGSLIRPATTRQMPGQTTPGTPGSLGDYAAAWQRPNYWAQLGAGAAFVDATSVGYGTLITQPGVQGTEAYIAQAASRATGYRLALDGGARLGEIGQLFGHVAHRHAQFEGDGFVPIGGQGVGVTYFDRAPNGSTGISLGSTGAYTSVHGTFSKYEADFAYRFDVGRFLGCEGDGPSYTAGLGLGYRRFDLSHAARQTSPTFDGIRSKAWLDSTTNFIGPRLEGGLSWDVAARVPFRVEINSYVVPGFRWGDGRAKQKSLCDLCPPDEQNLKIVRDQDRAGFGLVAGVTARLGVELTDALSLGLEGGYEYTNAVNTWRTPRGPFEAPADLATEPVKVGFVGVNIRYKF
jgi:hypothetical protein